ncbi:hypothetical protein Emag_000907 [Eimeria magna]
MAETGDAEEVQPEDRWAPLQAKDDKLNFLSPSFDPLLLLQQRPAAAAEASLTAASVVLPNIRLAELLLPWGHQPQSIAAAEAAAASEEDSAAAAAAAGTEPATQGHGERTKRSAFEARLNAAKNKQLKIDRKHATEATMCQSLHAGRLLPSRLGVSLNDEDPAAAPSVLSPAAACGAAAPPAAACGNQLKQRISRLRLWQQQKQQLEALVHPHALQLLQRCSQPDPTGSSCSTRERSCSSSSKKSVCVRGYLRWFDVHMTLVMQPAEIIGDLAQLQQHEQQQQQQEQQQQQRQQRGRRVDWLLIP